MLLPRGLGVGVGHPVGVDALGAASLGVRGEGLEVRGEG